MEIQGDNGKKDKYYTIKIHDVLKNPSKFYKAILEKETQNSL